MHYFRSASIGLGLVGLIAVGGSSQAQSVLVLNGTGVSSVSGPLTAAGFNVVSGTLDPGQISSNLAADPNIVEIWIWNDGTFGQTFSPADPLRDFDAADLAALDTFRSTHPHWILDCLAWRVHASLDEQNLTMNEALGLASAGGGIVLGTDDDSGGAIVQHVNQVANHVGLSPFVGTYNTTPAVQFSAGTFFSTPNAVNPGGIVGTQSYCDAPSGLQPNGIVLSTALFGSPGALDPAYPSPALANEVINGTLYLDVDHLITTSLPGGGFEVPSILVLNGVGVSTVAAPLAAAGFNVIQGTLNPGQIANALAANPSIVEIWIWNDGTYGNTGTPTDPARDFNALDLAALDVFRGTHPHWILDCLAWRSHTSFDEENLTKNEALDLAAGGGGVVLGTDDASGDALVQHVNQITNHVGLSPFVGTYDTVPAVQYSTGVFFNTPIAVNPTGIVGTQSYCDAPSGPQPNGMVLSIALFGSPGVLVPAYPSPVLGNQVIQGTLYSSVDHLVTTTLPGGGFGGNPTAAYCSGDGTGTACPCGNAGAVGAGCNNSFNTGGGVLSASGTARVSADSLKLEGSAMPSNASALYFQGTVPLNSGQGVTFGDGLRCVGGSVIRLGTRTNSAGMSGYGAPLGDTPISIRGAIPAAGGTFCYQVWYRNAAAFCTPSGFNLTNGLAVTWAP